MPSLFPMFDAPGVVAPAENPPDYPQTYQYDFRAKDFLFDGAGRLVLIDGHSAWVQWCIMAVLTERFEALIFDRSMGVDYDGLRLQPNQAAKQAWLEREITEALLVDPRTEQVKDFSFSWFGDSARVGFTVIPVIGTSEKVEVNIGG